MKFNTFGRKSYDFMHTAIKDDAKITILEGSVRSGKTVTMIWKLLKLIAEGPQGLGVITGVSKDTIYDNVLSDIFDVVGTGNYHYNRQSGDLEIMGDRWKVVGAKDEGSEKYIRGKTIAKAYCDELSLTPKSFFMMLLSRLSVEGSRLYATTNTDNPNHYLYRDFMTDPLKLASGLVRVLHFDLEDNPSLSKEYKDFIKASYAGVFYRRYIEGKWVIAEGVIYRDCWSEDLLYDEPGEWKNEIPKGLRNGYGARYVGVDYGTANPQVYYDVLDDGEDLWFDREYYWDSRKEMKQKTDGEYATDLQAFMGYPSDAQVILDPSAASFAAELQMRGIAVTDADNEVLDGIRMLAAMMARKKIHVHRRNCPHFQEEVQTYAWDEDAAERGKEQPIKQNDHCMDNARYIVKTKIQSWRLAA